MYGMVKIALCGGAQYCDQGPLDRAIAQGRFRDDLASIYLCLMDIAAGMTYLHSLGIVHRHATNTTCLKTLMTPGPFKTLPSSCLQLSRMLGADYMKSGACKIGQCAASSVATVACTFY